MPGGYNFKKNWKNPFGGEDFKVQALWIYEPSVGTLVSFMFKNTFFPLKWVFGRVWKEETNYRYFFGLFAWSASSSLLAP